MIHLPIIAALSVLQVQAVTIHVHTPDSQPVPGVGIRVTTLQDRELATGSTSRNGDFTTSQIPDSVQTIYVYISDGGDQDRREAAVAPLINLQIVRVRDALGWVPLSMEHCYPGKIVMYGGKWHIYHKGEFRLRTPDGRIVRRGGAFFPLTQHDIPVLPGPPKAPSTVCSPPTVFEPTYPPIRHYWVPQCGCY